MTADPKREQPDIPPQKPDIQPEPRPEEIPQDKDVSGSDPAYAALVTHFDDARWDHYCGTL